MRDSMGRFGALSLFLAMATGTGCRNSDQGAVPTPPRPPATTNEARYPVENIHLDPNAPPAHGQTPMLGIANPSDLPRGGGPSRLSDGDIAAVTNALNEGEARQAQLAVTRARSPEVRQFAEHMISQHQQLAREDAQLFARAGATATDNEVSRHLSAESQSVMQSLQSATPDDFDRVYIEAQVREHQGALQTIDSQLAASVTNPQVRLALSDTRSAVQQHLDDARRIQQTLMRMAPAPTMPPSGAHGSTGTPVH